MTTRVGLRAAVTIVATLAAGLIHGSHVDMAAQAACDRACLTGIAEGYLEALVTRDPMRASLARGVRYSENTRVLDVGEGLWVGAARGSAAFRVAVVDATTGQVGLFARLEEFGRPVLLAARLRVVGRRITEAEHVVARTLREEGLANLTTPRAAFAEDVPAAQRVARAEMLRLADGYYDALSTATSARTAFGDDCVRHENGVQSSTNRTAGVPPGSAPSASDAFAALGRLGCAAQIDSGMFAYITSIDLRRLHVVDETKGLVFGLSMFRHAGRLRVVPITGVPGVTALPMAFGPIDLQAAHVFKIAGGRLRAIEAMGHLLPYKSGSGWDREPFSGTPASPPAAR